MLKLVTVQGALDEVDSAPLLTELIFLAQVDKANVWELGVEEFELVNSTALHLAIHFHLD